MRLPGERQSNTANHGTCPYKSDGFFFNYNRDHEDGRHFAIGRIYNCNPSIGERYYLRLLLVSVPGPLLKI
jgi:hypothetical protein